MVEVEEVDGGLSGGGPGLWRLVPSALAPSGSGLGLVDFLPGGGRLGRRGGGRPWLHSGGGACELQGVAFWLVRGAAALV